MTPAEPCAVAARTGAGRPAEGAAGKPAQSPLRERHRKAERHGSLVDATLQAALAAAAAAVAPSAAATAPTPAAALRQMRAIFASATACCDRLLAGGEVAAACGAPVNPDPGSTAMAQKAAGPNGPAQSSSSEAGDMVALASVTLTAALAMDQAMTSSALAATFQRHVALMHDAVLRQKGNGVDAAGGCCVDAVAGDDARRTAPADVSHAGRGAPVDAKAAAKAEPTQDREEASGSPSRRVTRQDSGAGAGAGGAVAGGAKAGGGSGGTKLKPASGPAGCTRGSAAVQAQARVSHVDSPPGARQAKSYVRVPHLVSPRKLLCCVRIGASFAAHEGPYECSGFPRLQSTHCRF